MHNLRVLVVEDEADAAEIIDSLLRHYQLMVEHVVCAEDAFTALTTAHYDAAIIDLFLPGMDGLELIRRIRQEPRLAALPCIAVTAYSSSGLRKQALDAGSNRYYAKPLNPDELAQGLRDILT
jgi:CheY-like chemotaxis protein